MLRDARKLRRPRQPRLRRRVLQWPKRGRYVQRDVGSVVIFTSTCGHYRVQQNVTHGGPWLATEDGGPTGGHRYFGIWSHVSPERRHYRSKEAAMLACERLAQQRLAQWGAT